MSRYTYPRELRLLTPADFQNVFNNPPVKAVSNEFTFLAKPNQREHPRMGVTVSKKNAKRAVDRNRIKRIIRETYRLKQHKLAGFDIIVIAKPGVMKLDNQALRELLDYLWRKLGKRCNQYLLK
ncbi:ribonuclease P protein component [Idiomarina sp. A28L]|uniref:ribonuclease P protein component n=1 Tax=Idiomarina sp. A28L TaxID=1036674 RepID=UPI0002138D12|nr:ribonuclease P protein component [Idiomarina sp. A28L]EGN76053.1 ribonuclease P protein component [Idiomarina sp. A28L]